MTRLGSQPETCHIMVQPDGTVSVYKWGADQQGVTYTLVQVRPDWVVLKREGLKYWSGRGSQGYARARYLVFEIERVERKPDGGYTFVAQELTDFPVRASAVAFADVGYVVDVRTRRLAEQQQKELSHA